MKRNEPPIEFETPSGKQIILMYERPEYRAYEIKNGKKIPMGLGSTVPEPLIKYIKEEY